MIHRTRRVAARPKWLKMSGGRIRRPASAPRRWPPPPSHRASSTNPPPAVRTQVMRAAHSIYAPSCCSVGFYDRTHVPDLVPVRMLFTPHPPERVTTGDEHGHEGEHLEAALGIGGEDGRADVCHRERNRSVEHDARACPPHGDLLAPLAPEQVEEERDREEEGDTREQEEADQRDLQLQDGDDDRDHEDDREAPKRGIHLTLPSCKRARRARSQTS